jgi:hypothetical protein
MNAIELMLMALGVYLLIGFLFAIAFALIGAGRIDDVARHGTIGFRVLIVPGAAALWPMLLVKWIRTGRMSGTHEGHKEIVP